MNRVRAAIVLLFFLLSHLLAVDVAHAAVDDRSRAGERNVINPIIGDRSFFERFGRAPDATTDGEVRVWTHLAYAETLLRGRDVSHLSPELRIARMRNLDRLHYYRMRGRFPRNYDHPESRRPCFIDSDGTICAVGYLVEQSIGRQAAEHINSRFKYARIQEMDAPELELWLAGSGLTLEEAATIQPGYDWGPRRYIGGSAAAILALGHTYRASQLNGEPALASDPIQKNRFGFAAGITFERVPFSSPATVMVQVLYEQGSFDIEGRGGDVMAISSNGETTTSPTIYRAAIDYKRLNAGFYTSLPLYQFASRAFLQLGLGPSVGYTIAGDRVETLTLDDTDNELQLPEDMPGRLPDSRRTVVVGDGALSPFRLGIRVGLRGVILIKKERTRLIPSIWYDYTLTRTASGSPWHAGALYLGLDFQWRLRPYDDTVLGADED